MDTNNLSFGQRIDPESGLVESWFTHGALDRIKMHDLSGREILQYGSGLGDVWLSRRCKKLISIERDLVWADKVYELFSENFIDNARIEKRPCNDCCGMDEYYTAFPEDMLTPDVIIVDDAYRYECIVKAVEYSKVAGKKIMLIVDNWMQDYVFICPAAEELLKGHTQDIFPQHDHEDHEGNRWQTAIFYL